MLLGTKADTLAFIAFSKYPKAAHNLMAIMAKCSESLNMSLSRS